MQPGAMDTTLQADFSYKKKCILCLIGTKICCNCLGIILFLIAILAVGASDDTDNKAVWIIVLLIVLVVVIVDTVLAVLMYKAVNGFDCPRMTFLVKLGICIWVTGQIFGLISSIGDKENGNVGRWFGNFIISAVITGIWYWYIF